MIRTITNNNKQRTNEKLRQSYSAYSFKWFKINKVSINSFV